jgi:iron(III) transport system substrate-binding protein
MRSITGRSCDVGIRAALVLAVLSVACSGGAPTAPTNTAAAPQTTAGAPSLDALVAAAKTEGSVSWYAPSSETSISRVADAFEQKYGIKVQGLRFASAELLQRYSAEADSGKIVADVISPSGDVTAFVNDAINKGWIDPNATDNLPAVKSGEFPAKFRANANAPILDVGPWLIAYNSKLLKPEEVPKTWTDLTNPRFKGQLMMLDPRAAAAYFDVFDLLLRTYGETFYQQLLANNPRLYQGGVPGNQALGAGEGAVLFPTSAALAGDVAKNGAPVATVQPDLSVGIETKVVLSAKARTPHPNAGQLLANYLMSQEGNKVYASDPGTVSVYDTSGLPKDYTSAAPDAESKANQQKLLPLLGLS